MKDESKFAKKVKDQLKLVPRSWFFTAQLISIRGIPDIIGVVRGYFIALELKTEYGTASPLQLYTIEKIRQAGGFALLVDPTNVEAVLAALEELSLKGTPGKLLDRLESC